ncbi:MAG: tetratricopeptide repeat protein [Cytophagales bacterium]|nr:tetratricopeptide repeat protein [Armatimonadota bacterium]
MVVRRFPARCLVVLIAGGTLLCGTASLVGAAPAKPLVVLFPVSEQEAVGSGVTAAPQSPDGLMDVQRTAIAVRAVRDRFRDSGVAEAVLYNAEAPVFVRAALEAKLKLANPADPSASERMVLGKAIGAVSLLTVRAQPLKDKPGAVEIVLESTEVASRKTWTDRTQVTGSNLSVSLTTGTAISDTAAPRTPADNSAWMSASNTLVLRYLAGPLGEYTRALAPPGVVPPPPQAALPPPEIIAPVPPPVVTPLPQSLKPSGSSGPADGAATATAPMLAPPKVIAPAPSVPDAGLAPFSAPAAAAPQLTEASQASQAAVAQTARQQAEALIAGGDLTGAIVILRKSVNQAPRSLSLRVALAKAYVASGRTNDAAAEARRALTIAAPNADRGARLEMTRLLADAYAKNGDSTAARATYEEILAAQPQAYWARIALGDLLLGQGDNAGAEAAYRAVRSADPGNREAVLGVARALMARGDFSGALAEVGVGGTAGGSQGERLSTASALFDEIAVKTANSVVQNREAFDGGQLSREAFYKATTAQSARAGSLLSLLRSAAPPAAAAERITRPYRHRVFAATLLSQAVDGMLSYLQTGDRNAGEQAKVLLTEFRKELAAAS